MLRKILTEHETGLVDCHLQAISLNSIVRHFA